MFECSCPSGWHLSPVSTTQSNWEYFYSPLNRKRVDRRVTAAIEFSGTHLYPWRETDPIKHHILFFCAYFTLKKPALVFRIHFILHTKDLSVSTALLLWSSPEKENTITCLTNMKNLQPNPKSVVKIHNKLRFCV